MSTISAARTAARSKYIGDAVMAFWGAPVDDAQHARNGVLAAIEMQRERGKLTQVRRARLADAQDRRRREFGTVRVATWGRRCGVRTRRWRRGQRRLPPRGPHKGYGVGILVGEATRNAVADVVFREVDRSSAGKHEAVTIYEPIALASEVDKDAHDELEAVEPGAAALPRAAMGSGRSVPAHLQRMNPACELYQVYAEKVAEKAPPTAAARMGRRDGVREK